MESLTREQIEYLRSKLFHFLGSGAEPHWSQLFYTAQLGAEFIKVTENTNQKIKDQL